MENPMKQEPLLWKGQIVGYVDEFDDDSTVFFGVSSLVADFANKKIFARWQPLGTEHTRAFLKAILAGGVEVEVDLETYYVFDEPANDIKLQRLDIGPRPQLPDA